MQPSQGREPADTPPEELDRLIGAAAKAARELVGSRRSDRADWLEHLATQLDAAAAEVVPIAARETHLGVDRLQGELKRTTFQLRLFAEVLRDYERDQCQASRQGGMERLADRGLGNLCPATRRAVSGNHIGADDLGRHRSDHRFLRPVTDQDAPDDVLPPALQEDNPWRLPRRVDGVLQQG